MVALERDYLRAWTISVVVRQMIVVKESAGRMARHRGQTRPSGPRQVSIGSKRWQVIGWSWQWSYSERSAGWVVELPERQQVIGKAS